MNDKRGHFRLRPATWDDIKQFAEKVELTAEERKSLGLKEGQEVIRLRDIPADRFCLRRVKKVVTTGNKTLIEFEERE